MDVADLGLTTVAAQMPACAVNPPQVERRLTHGQLDGAGSGLLRYQDQVE